MSNIQATLDSLQPYVHGIRYVKGVPVVDMILNDSWTLLEDPLILKVKGDDALNYHMIYSEAAGVGLDELLNYVDRTIKANLDREKKHELLKAKVNELKEVFKRNSLSKLGKLKFTFGEDDEFSTNINDVDIEEPKIKVVPIELTKKNNTNFEEPIEEEVEEIGQPISYLDENKQPIELTEEDREILEEEARAERNRKAIEAKKNQSEGKPKPQRVELPPKRKMVVAEMNYDTDCECGPNEACEKCIDKKDY